MIVPAATGTGYLHNMVNGMAARHFIEVAIMRQAPGEGGLQMPRLGDWVPRAVIDAWGLSADDYAVRLQGGMGRSIRAGDIVLKPVEDAEEAGWCQEHLSQLRVSEVRIPQPVATRDGRWVADGWAASVWVLGAPGSEGRWDELLAVSERLHLAIASWPRPTFLERRRHRWAVADRAAWGEGEIAWVDETAPLAQRLCGMLQPSNHSSQIIHGDLGGNVLFFDGLPPAVIDFSPYWRPPRFADAVLLVDGLLWHDASDVQPHIPQDDDFRQMMIRAALFRLGALNERARTTGADCRPEILPFDRVASCLEGGNG